MNKLKRRFYIALVLFFVLTGVLVLSILYLRKVSSDIYKINQENSRRIEDFKEITKASKSIDEYSVLTQTLKHKILESEKDIPFVVGYIESYADALSLPMEVENISFKESFSLLKQPNETSVEDSLNNTQENKEIKEDSNLTLVINITLYGKFEDLFNFIKIIENLDYFFSIDSYEIKRVVIEPSSRADDKITFSDFHLVKDDGKKVSIENTTWFLELKLSLLTNIKQ